MPIVDWSSGDDQPPGRGMFNLPDPGFYLAKVEDCVEKIASRAQVPMFSYSLVDVATGEKLCYDNIMLGGKGANIGLAKLSGLGFGKDDTQLEAEDLNGHMVFVHVKARPYVDKNGKDRDGLEVDIYSKGSNCGYFKLNDPPNDELRDLYERITSEKRIPF